MSLSRGREGMRLYLFKTMASKITALKQQKRNPSRVNVYLDGEFAFGLAKITAAWLNVGQELSAEEIQELQAGDEVEKAYQQALKFISYRPRSTYEVEKNLLKHEVDEGVIDAVIVRLQDKKWLDDEDFAAAWVENRNTFRPRGRYALQTELRQKGLKDAIIERALQGLDEGSLARKASEKKMRSFAALDKRDFQKKLAAYLARRGFEYGIIKEVCTEAWETVQSTQSSTHPEKGIGT